MVVFFRYENKKIFFIFFLHKMPVSVKLVIDIGV